MIRLTAVWCPDSSVQRTTAGRYFWPRLSLAGSTFPGTRAGAAEPVGAAALRCAGLLVVAGVLLVVRVLDVFLGVWLRHGALRRVQRGWPAWFPIGLLHHYGGMNPWTRLPDTSRQPSTNTKKINLNGRLIALGGSIIMPSDISTLPATRSITRNGR